MPVLLSTGETGNRIDILQPNGVTEDLTPARSELHVGLIVSDDTVNLQVRREESGGVCLEVSVR